VQWFWWLPVVTFALLATCEWLTRQRMPALRYGGGDWLLNLTGLFLQGVVVPLAAYAIAMTLLPPLLPAARATLALGWWGAFLLNVVCVDLLYYWQHRWFHRAGLPWSLHLCHHASPGVDVWATARNSLLTNFLFVYLLVNPLLGYLCDVPDGFFFGAAVTASLDLWRHSRVSLTSGAGFWTRAVSWLLVTPAAHHLHHSREGERLNFGANFMLWDRLFGTARDAERFPADYGVERAPAPFTQFLLPWARRLP
jgi:sterol desaturase/sphingolipid hydroxylase (fatty acid hydroxylase superfamily)